MAMAVLTLASCMKLKKKGDEDFSTAEPPQPVTELSVPAKEPQKNTATELTYEYKNYDSATPEVSFHAPTNWASDIVYEKAYGDKNFQGVASFNSEGVWNDKLISDQKTVYKFSAKVAGQLVVLDEVEVLPVLNLEVAQDLSLKKQYNFSNKTKVLFFSNLKIASQKHLYLEDFSGEIIIQNIETTEGYLQTFSQEYRATSNLDGRSGGKIEVKIIQGQGSLNVVMRGEDGLDGAPALPAGPELKGANGDNAHFIKTQFIGGGLLCEDPVPAKDGSKGLPGHPGNNGGNGGDSGRADVHNFSANLEVKLSTDGGQRGIGTIGGEGGEGGDAGAGLSSILSCPALSPGVKGGKGDSGASGHSGHDGPKQQSCLISADRTKQCTNE